MKRLRSCTYCGRVHAVGLDCGQKPKRKAKEVNEITKLRTCRKWGRTREAAYDRDHHLCRLCLAQGRLETERLEAHHIVPLAEDQDLAYVLDNIVTLCASCHKQADRGQISRAYLRYLAAADGAGAV